MNGFRISLRLLLSLMLIALFATIVSGASAATEPISLGIKPVGETGTYFTLAMSPGESRQLTVSLGNFGTENVEARTFAADAYTMVNGGFGVRLDGEPTSGTTTWLNYPAETLLIEARKSVTRTFSLAIPADAQPGEYLTGLVIQNATPVGVSDSGSVAINQINRQVIAVSITVPGPLVPGLEINQVTYKPVGDRSVLSFGVANTGNMKLKPSGEFTLKSTDGQEISSGSMQMNSFYAGTATNVEGLLAQKLNPGDYIASLTLTDAASGVTATKSLAMNVPIPAVGAANTANSASTGASVNQASVQAPATSKTTNGSQLVLLGTAGAVIVGLLLILFMLMRRKRIRQATSKETTPSLFVATSRSVTVPPVSDQTRPKSILVRQLAPRDDDRS